MSIQDETALNNGHPEAGSDDPGYCRGDNMFVSKDQEEIVKIMREGRENCDNDYTIAKRILEKFVRWEKKGGNINERSISNN